MQAPACVLPPALQPGCAAMTANVSPTQAAFPPVAVRDEPAPVPIAPAGPSSAKPVEAVEVDSMLTLLLTLPIVDALPYVCTISSLK